MTDFPRRIAVITAPLVVLTLSYKRLYLMTQKYREIFNYSALLALVIITIIFCFTLFTTGFPISKSIYNLEVGSGTSIYVATIRMILTNWVYSEHSLPANLKSKIVDTWCFRLFELMSLGNNATIEINQAKIFVELYDLLFFDINLQKLWTE